MQQSLGGLCAVAVYARELRPELLRALPSRPAFARRRAPCCLRAHTTLTTSQLTQLTHLLNPTQARNNTLATSNAHLFSKISTILFAARFRNTSRSNAGSTALMAFNIRYGVAFTLLLALVCARAGAGVPGDGGVAAAGDACSATLMRAIGHAMMLFAVLEGQIYALPLLLRRVTCRRRAASRRRRAAATCPKNLLSTPKTPVHN